VRKQVAESWLLGCDYADHLMGGRDHAFYSVDDADRSSPTGVLTHPTTIFIQDRSKHGILVGNSKATPESA